MMRVFVLYIMLVLSAAAGAAEVTDEQVAAARQGITKQYGTIIAEARGSETEADDVALARQLLIAASDGSEDPATQLALIQTALDLVIPLNSPEAAGLIRQGMDLAHSVRPYKPLERAALEKDLAANRLKKAEAKKASVPELQALAGQVIAASVAYTDAALGETDIPRDAESILASARTIAARHKLKEGLDALKGAEDRLRAERTWRMKLGQAEAKLQMAVEGGDAAAITSASRVVGRLHLEHTGDLTRAAKYFSAMGDVDDRAVIAGASFLENPESLDADSLLNAAEALTRMARTLEAPAGRAVAICAKKMCEHCLVGQPSVLHVTKARLLIAQLDAILGQSPGDKLLAALQEEYKGVNGKVQVIEGKRIQVSYDFSDPAQLKDWYVREGIWEVGKGVLACKTDPYASGSSGCKLLFRFDRPFQVSFQAQADNEIGVVLLPCGLLSKSYLSDVSSLKFNLSLTEGITSEVLDQSFGDHKAKMVKGKVYRFGLSGDGASLDWTINGKHIHAFKATAVRDYLARKGFRLVLCTVGSDFKLTSYDNVVIEGTVVVSLPDEAGAATKPAGTQPADVGPASRPGESADQIEKFIRDLLNK